MTLLLCRFDVALRHTQDEVLIPSHLPKDRPGPVVLPAKHPKSGLSTFPDSSLLLFLSSHCTSKLIQVLYPLHSCRDSSSLHHVFHSSWILATTGHSPPLPTSSRHQGRCKPRLLVSPDVYLSVYMYLSFLICLSVCLSVIVRFLNQTIRCTGRVDCTATGKM